MTDISILFHNKDAFYSIVNIVPVKKITIIRNNKSLVVLKLL